MNRRFAPLARFAPVVLALGLFSFGCENSPWSKQNDKADAKAADDKPKADSHRLERLGTKNPMPDTAVAVIQGAGEHKDKVTGTVAFIQQDDGVKVIADIDGLTPGEHGIHVHESADLSSADLKSAGPHFNPDGTKHGGPDSEMRHAGDLGNLIADDKGHAHIDKVFKGISVKGSKNSVMGHSVIIHAGEDDLKTDPSGKSGDRIAGGVVEAKASTTIPAAHE